MRGYNFDEVIERRGTGCLKYDHGAKRRGRDDLLPLWIADMDFALPEEILLEIKTRTDHGIFGYTEPDEEYYDVLSAWFAGHYGYEIDEKRNTVTPGVVFAIAAAIRAFTLPGDGVLIQEPVYYPFRETIELNRRRTVNNQLVCKDGRYEMDPEDLERRIVSEKVKLFILCSPHNPVGRVWTKEELEVVAGICKKHGVIVVSDEIHCDFIYTERGFVSCAALDCFPDNTVICTSPSKTFNMAGLQNANIIINNRELRRAFRRAIAASGYSQPNVLGLEGAKAAYRYGEEWLSEVLLYLKGNIGYFRDFIKRELPGIRLIEPEGTYLLWTDLSEMFDDPKELKRFITDDARLWLDDGDVFSRETALFERFNIACPKSILEEALMRLKKAAKRRYDGKSV